MSTQAIALDAVPPTKPRSAPYIALGAPMLGLMLAGFILPGVLTIAVSLNGSFALFSDITLEKYISIFGSSYFWRVLSFTLLVSAGVAAISAVLAYPLAMYLARATGPGTAVAYLVTFTPLAVGMNMLTIGWLIVLGRSGVINSTLSALGVISEPLPLAYGATAVVIGLIHVSFTFMVLPLESVIRNIPSKVEAAARSLGAPKWKAFLTVTLPLSVEGLAAGMLIVFMQSCGAFVIPLLLGGSTTVMLPVAIW